MIIEMVLAVEVVSSSIFEVAKSSLWSPFLEPSFGTEEEELQYKLGDQSFLVHSLPHLVTVIEHALCTGHHTMINKAWLCFELTVRELQTHVQIALRM